MTWTQAPGGAAHREDAARGLAAAPAASLAGGPARQRLGGRRRRRHRPLRHRDRRQAAGCASSTSPSPRPASASRTCGCSSAPTRTPTTTAWRRRSSRAPAASSGCTPPGSTSGCIADDPAAALEQRIEVARQSGVPPAALERYRESRKDDDDTGIDAIVEPDRDLLPGVEVETDLGAWQVHETPGHAPSHVVLHQPERKLMISGDHLLGRTVLFFDHGHSPDPVGEFLRSLDEVEPLDVDLCPARPRPPLPRTGDEDRRGAGARSTRCSARCAAPSPRASGQPFEIVAEIVGPDNVNSPVSAWALQIVLSCLDHMRILGEVGAGRGSRPPALEAPPGR